MASDLKAVEFEERDLAVEPIERSDTIPAEWYTNPDIGELEREILFARCWQYVGHLAQLPEPGDCLTAKVAGRPVIVVRGADDTVRGFYNVCRHRGGPLRRKHGMLQCRYHGWTYRPDGSLRGVPRMDRTELFDKRDYGLVSVAAEVWEGLVFVSLAKDPPSLERFIDGISERIAPIDLSTMHFARRVEYDIACNWKVYVDNYLEGYHVPFVHPELCELYEFEEYRTETAGYHSLQTTPLTSDDNLYSDGSGKAFYYFVFPNLMLNVLPGRLQTNAVIPLEVRRTKVIFDYFYRDEARRAELAAADQEYSDDVQREDIEICERVQEGIESPVYERGRFSPDAEQGVYHFQSLLRKSFASWRSDRG